MRRRPRDQAEAIFIRHLRDCLYALAGDPDHDSGTSLKYGSLVIDVSDDPVKRGIYYSFRQEEGGAGFDMLPLLGLAITDITAWIATLSAADRTATKPPPPSRERAAELQRRREGSFAILRGSIVATPDPRIGVYLEGRGIPKAFADEFDLVLSRSPRYRNGQLEPGSFGMVAWATTDTGEALAGQVLTLREDGTPILLPGALDRTTGQRKACKERLTWAPRSGWKATAAWRIPAAAGSETDPRFQAMVLVEGVEDALSVRVVGWMGPIAATLGKGGLKGFAPTCAEVILVPDHDVGDDEILSCVEFHVAGGRKVRVARLPASDPNDLLKGGLGDDLLQEIFGAAEHTSVMGDIIRDLAKYPFTPSGDTRFDYDLPELVKRHKVSRSTLQKRRREERQKVEAAEKARKEASTAGAAGGDDKRTVIEPSAEPVPPGPEVPDEVLKIFEDYVVAPAEGMLAATILWAMHTAEFERWAYTPRCYIRAPAHESGKTRLASLIRLLVPNSQMLLRSSGPGLFRRIDALNASGLRFVPFIDEIDGIFHGEKDEEVALRAIFNNNETALPQEILLAHETVVKGARKIEAKTFYALVPMLFSGLDILPATMQSRAISIDVFRETPRVRTIDVAKVQKAAARLRRWVIDNADNFDAEPEMPEMPRELSPRERDTWTPLVSIAKTIGGQWPELVRLAMLDAFGSQPPFNDNQYVLLDVRRVFDKRRENNQRFPDLISSTDLALEMAQQEHGAELFFGLVGGAGAAREQRLATRLKVWRVRSRRDSVPGYPGADRRGRVRFYTRAQFVDLWRRYGIDAAIAADEAEDKAEDQAEDQASPASAVDPVDPGGSELPQGSPANTGRGTKKGDSQTEESRNNITRNIPPLYSSFSFPGGDLLGDLGAGRTPGPATAPRENGPEAEKQPESGDSEPSGAPTPLFRDVPKGRRKPHELFPLVDIDDYGVPTWAVQPTRVHQGMLDRHLAKLRAELAARKRNGSAGGGQ